MGNFPLWKLPLLLLCFAVLAILLAPAARSLFVSRRENFAAAASHGSDEETKFPRRVYTYWHRADDPVAQVFLEFHRRSVEQHAPGWDLVFLHGDNVHEYVPQRIIDMFRDCAHDPTRFSDALRMAVLWKHGGVWMDMTVLVLRPETVLEAFRRRTLETRADALVFEFAELTEDRRHPYLENWFLMAPRGSPFVGDVLRDFLTAKHVGFAKYRETVLRPALSLKNTLGDDPHEASAYLIQHAIAQHLLVTRGYVDVEGPAHFAAKENRPARAGAALAGAALAGAALAGAARPYALVIKQASESMFRLQISVNWDRDAIVKRLTETPLRELADAAGLYAVKLVGTDRKALTQREDGLQKLAARLREFQF